MTENDLFDLEKIKEIISPFNDLQDKVNLLDTIPGEIEDTKKLSIAGKISPNIDLVLKSLQKLLDELLIITRKNINLFNNFQGELLAKFKESKTDSLKKLGFNKTLLQIIGNFLIKNKNISKIVSNISYIHSIKIDQWLELVDSLKQNTTFNMVIQKIDTFYQELIKIKLNKELQNIHDEVDDEILQNFKKTFEEDPNITFREYLQIYEDVLSQEELDGKKDFIEREKKRQELEKLKEKQERQQETFQDYLRLPVKEFERKRRKQSREKLGKIDPSSNNIKKIEISEEASKKIEDFKSSFDQSFKDNYLVQKDEGTNPIELIRERKKKKIEEFKKYKKHFEKE